MPRRARRRVSVLKDASGLHRRPRSHPRRHWFRGHAADSLRRIRWTFFVSVVALAVALVFIVHLQVARASGLQRAGRQQWSSGTALVAPRGSIFSEDGSELAMSVPSSTVYADPAEVVDAAGTATVLGEFLDLSPEKVASLQISFTEKKTRFVYVARQIDSDLAGAVKALKLPGISVLAEAHRTMPSGDVARGVIGRTDIDGRGADGSGLEKQYDAVLTGTDGERVSERDQDGNSLAGSTATLTAPIPGDDLVLTIDRSLQYQVEQALLQRVDETAARGGTVVVMDTATGNIRAMANVRRNDDGIAEVTWANLAAIDAREPGSVAKVFSVAAALDSGVATPDTTLEVPGVYVFDRGTKFQATIRDAEPHGPEPYTVRQIMAKSSNIGTMLLSQRLTPEQLHEYQEAFGFGAKTALDFPGETAGILRPADELRGSETATVSYGYGFATSSVQLVAGVNAIANGGVYVAPRLVDATIDVAGQRISMPASVTHPVVSELTAEQMVDMMTDVVCRGTAKQARMDGIVTVAGKTGTAYKVQDNKTYQSDEGGRAYFASFVGFLPASNPQVTILASIDEPDPMSQDRFGGTAAAPLFVQVAMSAMSELQIVPPAGDTGCPAR